MNYVEFEQRMTSQTDDNAECIRPDNSQGDVCGNTERPESNEKDNAEQNLYGNLKY